jgi:hypothetical protein
VLPWSGIECSQNENEEVCGWLRGQCGCSHCDALGEAFGDAYHDAQVEKIHSRP